MNVRWIHEVARPHPVLFFDEACLTQNEYAELCSAFPQIEKSIGQLVHHNEATVNIDLLDVDWNYKEMMGVDCFQALKKHDSFNLPLDRYVQAALEKWRSFAAKVMTESDTVYILDSALFQYQIFIFLLKNAAYGELEAFVKKLADILSPLNPALVYLHRESVKDSIDYFEKIRGTRSLEKMWERDKHEPYYHNKPKGAEGARGFLQTYGEFAAGLYDSIDCKKATVEIVGEEWQQCEDALFAFLSMERTPPVTAQPVDGLYRAEKYGWEIVVDGLRITDPEGKRRKLLPKSSSEFHLECLPTTLRYINSDAFVISGDQICAQWTTLGTVYRRHQ